jgi:nucleotide-binding universal stress UspA family protein
MCGTDFSPASQVALRTAGAIAARLGCRLEIVSAIEPLFEEAARARHQLDSFANRVDTDLRAFATQLTLPADRVGFHVEPGEPARVLMAVAAAHHARFIVVGTRGWSQAARLFMGSTSLRLLRATDRPVLVIDGDEPSAVVDPTAPVSRIVCGVDFSSGSRAATTAAAELARDLGVGVTLVHAVSHASIPVGWDGLVRDIEADRAGRATTQLDEIARGLSARAESKVRTGSAVEVLTEEVASDPRAIVAVGLQGVAGHRLGSTALRVLTAARVPVLAVPG